MSGTTEGSPSRREWSALGGRPKTPRLGLRLCHWSSWWKRGALLLLLLSLFLFVAVFLP